MVLQDSEIKLHFRDPDWVRGGALRFIGVLLAAPLALPISHVGHEVIATDVRVRVRVSGFGFRVGVLGFRFLGF